MVRGRVQHDRLESIIRDVDLGISIFHRHISARFADHDYLLHQVLGSECSIFLDRVSGYFDKQGSWIRFFLKSHVLRFGFVDQLTARIRISDMPASRVRLF